MANIIGIDLGTTMSAIAKLNDLAKPEIIPNNDGDRITPSVILFDDETLIVGEGAKGQAGLSDKIAKEFKREMHNPDYRFKVDDKQLSATELSSLVLKKLTQNTNSKDVVISVPAYFKESQRKATMNAGKLADLNVLAIINEPTAAAIYYASIMDLNNKTVMIYDLGGGTFDVSIVKIDGNNVTVLSSEGDHHLGGVDFDNIVLEIAAQKYKNKNNENPFKDDIEKQDRLIEAEKIKKQLSSRPKQKWGIKPDSGINMTVEISRDEFEEKLSSHISKTEILVEKALMEADLEAEDIDDILLVGGSTRIPAFTESIKNLINKEPKKDVNPDEAVALGAAIKAGLVMIEKDPDSVNDNIKRELSNTKLTDVANHSYGTIAINYDEKLEKHILVNAIIIPKNTQLPCSKSESFFTSVDNQEAIDASVTQGESEDVDFVDVITKQKMQLPPNRPKGQELEFIYEYDANQIMHCIFKDIESGRTEEANIHLGEKTSSGDVNDFVVE